MGWPGVQSPVWLCGAAKGLDWGRILLAQEDGQHYQGEDGQELALPVLEGFKPEAAAPQVLPAGRGGQAPGDLLIHRCAPAPGQMQEEAPDEKDGKDDGQRVTVEKLPDSPFADCPGSGPRQNAFLLVLPLQRARFRRALLPQSDRDQHVHAHLQELAFPVLEGGADEMTAVQVCPQVQSGPVGLAQFLVMAEEACPYLAHKKAGEPQEQHNRETVSPPHDYTASNHPYRR